jgi:catechol 2,3-dioxygenase-like lactoylglutathione lyase family enzyme
VLGRFHEISIQTTVIRESVEFYERLGFTQASTNDTWTHPYGVLTDGRVFIGLHQRRFASPALAFVHVGVAQFANSLEERGIVLETRNTSEDTFNEIGFRDPDGQSVIVLEARTYSPVTRAAEDTSLCGYFTEYSMPSTEMERAREFWEPMGFVATEEPDAPYAHMPLTSDHLDIAFHRPRTLDRPMLVFRDANMRDRLARIRSLGVKETGELPRGLPPAANALIEAPEGTALLLLEGES